MSAAASEAAVKALIFTMAGSHTQASKLSVMSSLLMSTPYHLNPECRGGGGEGGREIEGKQIKEAQLIIRSETVNTYRQSKQNF